MPIYRLLAALLLTAGLTCPVPAQADEAAVATTWRLLDYIAVDYREAVADGEVVNALEYEEMLDFSASAANMIGALPPTGDPAEGAALATAADALQQAIQAKAPPDAIDAQARALAAGLVAAYPIPLAPPGPPDHARGAGLYASLCASCHGDGGAGDGMAGEGLDPAPTDFTDRSRADQRSVFALYQVIDQGLEGTGMVSYAGLPVEDRWALATYVGSIAYPEARAAAGRALLEGDTELRASMDMDRYVSATPAELAAVHGPDDAAALVAYLRRNPQALEDQDTGTGSSLALSRALLSQSLAAYRESDARRATQLALDAYLDGFEPVEPMLAARDKPLMLRIEAAMGRLRGSIADGVDAAALATEIEALQALFGEAETVLAEERSSATAGFVAAFTILLREGLEALLIVIAMIAMLRKANRREMLPFVHAGWVAALLAGGATWVLSTWVMTISGATRELTEGLGSLLAALVLVWVGIWMHGKSQADAWQRYVREKLGQALGRSSGWFLLGLVFVVVYREVFETILFYAAIWSQGSRNSVVAGGVVAALVLVALGWMMMRFSLRLPIGQFFRYSALLIAVLAVVLIGKAVSALQEAGVLPVAWIDGAPRIEILGIYPTLQGIGAQLALALVLVVGFYLAARPPRALPEPGAP